MSAQLQLLRPAQVASLIGVNRTTLWRWTKKGSFPAPVQLGRNAVGFRQAEVAAWIESRPASTNSQSA